MTQKGTIRSVGRPIDGVEKTYGQGPTYNFRYGYHTLDIFLDDPTPEETQAFENGRIRFGYWRDRNVIWVIFLVDGMEWGDVPYTPHLVEPEGRIIPQLQGEEFRYPLSMTLIDSRNGIVRKLRMITMSPAMSRWIASETQEIMEQEDDEAERNRQVEETLSKFEDSESMVPMAQVMEYLGEDA